MRSALIAQVLERVTAGHPHERALFRALDGAHYGINGPQLAVGIEDIGDRLADHPQHADTLLSMMPGDPTLEPLALQRLMDEPNAYWPNIYLGRLSLYRGNIRDLREHAYIAHGHHPSCFWPALLIAYADLHDRRFAAGHRWITKAVAASPDNLEAAILALAFAVTNGRYQEVGDLLDDQTVLAHLQYFQGMPEDHPITQIARFLRMAGLVIPEGPATLGPAVSTSDDPRI